MISEAPLPITNGSRSLKKWVLKKTISGSTRHLHTELLRLNIKICAFTYMLLTLVEKMSDPVCSLSDLDVGFISKGGPKRKSRYMGM